MSLGRSWRRIGIKHRFHDEPESGDGRSCLKYNFYAYKGDVEDAVDISLVREGGELIVTLIDHGIAFDPTLRKDPDITLSAEDRPIGGLGIS